LDWGGGAGWGSFFKLDLIGIKVLWNIILPCTNSSKFLVIRTKKQSVWFLRIWSIKKYIFLDFFCTNSVKEKIFFDSLLYAKRLDRTLNEGCPDNCFIKRDQKEDTRLICKKEIFLLKLSTKHSSVPKNRVLWSMCSVYTV